MQRDKLFTDNQCRIIPNFFVPGEWIYPTLSVCDELTSLHSYSIINVLTGPSSFFISLFFASCSFLDKAVIYRRAYQVLL